MDEADAPLAEPDERAEINALWARLIPQGEPQTPTRSESRRDRRKSRWPILLIGVWATLAAIDILHVVPGSSRQLATQTSPSSALTARPRPSEPSPSPTVRASTPSGRRSVGSERGMRPLQPASASAYGPSGTASSGDDAGSALMAIDPSLTTGWTTSWYQTAQFGGLQSGTGLLIDMGRPVKVRRVGLLLGSQRGAALQVLVGNSPDRTTLRTESRVSDVGGAVRLRLSRPERARYLLIWFTSLPPDSSGTFQATIYNVKIIGTARLFSQAGTGR